MESNHSYSVAYDGMVLQFQVLPSRGDVKNQILICKTYRYDTASNSFTKIIEGTITLKKKDLLSINAVSCVVDFGDHLYHPVISLTYLSSTQTPIFMLFVYNVEKNIFTNLGDVSSSSDCNVRNVYLVDGPALIYLFENKFHVIERKSSCLELSETVYSCVSNTYITSIKWVSALQESITILASASSTRGDSMEVENHSDSFDLFNNDELENMKWVLICLNKHKKAMSLQDCGHIPHEYSSITNSTLLTHKHHFVPYHIEIDGNAIKENESDIDIFLTTAMSQLVNVVNGRIKNVCQLPFNDVSKMQFVITNGGEEIVVVQSGKNGVCTIGVETFKVTNHWPDYETVLLDDFMLSGCDQLLLPPAGSESELLDSFFMTDLITTWSQPKVSLSTPDHQSEDSSSNLSAAVEALDKRLQQNISALRSLQLLCEQKESVIRQSKDALFKMADNDKTPSQRDPSLIPLANDQQDHEDPYAPQGMGNTTKVHQTIETLHIWQRIVDQNFVIGLHGRNIGNGPIHNIHLSLIKSFSDAHTDYLSTELSPTCSRVECPADIRTGKLHKEETTYTQSQTLPYVDITKEEEQDTKRQKTQMEADIDLDRAERDKNVIFPMDTFSLVSKAPVPSFGSVSVVRYNLLICWKERVIQSDGKNHQIYGGDENNVNGDVPSLGGDGCPIGYDSLKERTSCVGTCTLSAQDVLNRTYEVYIEDVERGSLSNEDTASLNFAQLETDLTLMSSHSRLSNILPKLCSSLSFVVLKEDGGDGCGYICKTGPLCGVRVYIICHTQGHNGLSLKVYTRDKDQLVLFCRGLQSILPDDVTIQPYQDLLQKRVLLKDAMKALNHELSCRVHQNQSDDAKKLYPSCSVLDAQVKSDIAIQLLEH